VVDVVVVVVVGWVGAAGDRPDAVHVPVPGLTRTVATLIGLCATSGLIRTESNLPAQMRELRIPERNETAIRTG